MEILSIKSIMLFIGMAAFSLLGCMGPADWPIAETCMDIPAPIVDQVFLSSGFSLTSTATVAPITDGEEDSAGVAPCSEASWATVVETEQRRLRIGILSEPSVFAAELGEIPDFSPRDTVETEIRIVIGPIGSTSRLVFSYAYGEQRQALASDAVRRTHTAFENFSG
jgi:hypothetical protein